MVIRQAKEEDMVRIADVHIQCFPNSFSTQLGKGFGGALQQRFYMEYFKDVPELFLVAEDDELPEKKTVGFCMGYYLDKNDYIKKFFKNNFFRIALRIAFLLFTGNKAAWNRVIGCFKKSEAFSVVDDSIKVVDEVGGDILSICVLPEYRGCGVAQKLIEGYQEVLKENRKKICLLTVALDNGRGIRFYERNGFVPYREAGGGSAYLC